MKDGLELEDFFRGLSNTVTGEAETAYGMELERMLSERTQASGVTWDIVAQFFDTLKRHFPVQTPERMREFASFRRKTGESLLATYGRLRELAADMECRDEWRLVSKFLNCLDERVAGDVRGRVFEMGPSATLEHAYELAKKYELGLRLYEMERGGVQAEGRRGSAWAAVATGEASSRRTTREAETRRCHRCGLEGHLQRDCSRPPRCDHYQKEGHMRRECPEVPTCENCGRRGHWTSDCYSRRPGSAGPRNEKDLEAQLLVLQARIRELEGSAHKESAMLAREEEEGSSEAEFVLMVRAPRQREEIGLRSDQGKRRELPAPRVRRFRGYAAEPEQEMTSERHPKERMVCQPSVLTIKKGAITVGGVTVAQAIIDTGAHHILLGKGLAQRLELDLPSRLITQGILVMTAEGGEPKWMPCTRMPVEVILQPGTKDECRIRMRCGLSPSEDFDLLIGMELLYRVGATICTWQEKVLYRTQYWRNDGPVGTLPVHFVRREPREAFRVRMAQVEEQIEDWSWKQYVLEQETRKAEEEGTERSLALPPRLSDLTRLQEPLTIVELFGGIGTGLAAALKAGCRVQKWVLVEIDPVVRRMAFNHARKLRGIYPTQLMLGVEAEAEEESLYDIREVAAEDVRRWGRVDLLVAGWECQGVSRAGKGKGLDDPRSTLFAELLRVMKLIYQQHGEYLYILQNPDFSTDCREPVHRMQEVVAGALGPGVAWDAVQQGSYAHRVRRYWQNGVSEGRLRWELIQTERPSPRPVEDILEMHREPAPVTKPDHPSQFQCNEPRLPREAWPTLMAHHQAHGFVWSEGLPGPGMVYDRLKDQWEEPSARERELAMGFVPDATAAPGVEEAKRREALGRAMDVEAVHWLMHVIQMHLVSKQLEMEVEVGGPGDASAEEVRASQQRAEQRLLDLRVEWQQQRERGWALMALGVLPGGREEVADGEPVSPSGAGVAETSMGQREPGAGSEPEAEIEEGGSTAAVRPAAEEDGAWEIGEGLKGNLQEQMGSVLRRLRQAFAFTLQELGKYNGGEMEIRLTEEVPVYQRKRRMSPGDLELCQEKCRELLEAGLIRPSESEYAAATVVAARKELTGEVLSRRMCGDYRDLNKLTVANRYHMPTPEEIFDKLQGAAIFNTLDLRQGFNQIRIKEADVRKTAFHGPDGLYEWLFMPFGLKNASAVFQKAMDRVLRALQHCAACYIDDVVVFSSTPEQHVKDVQQVLEAIKGAGLTCHPKKCRFGTNSVRYLGFEVGGGQMTIQQAKVAVLDNLATPSGRSALRAILGFLNYYRKFVPNFSRRAAPLNKLLREDVAWKWGEAEQGALRDLLEAVKSGPVLLLPMPGARFVLYTDWSSAGMGAVLSQQTEQGERVVAFASRSCNAAEANYSSYEGEGLAAVWAVTHFRVYLQGREFTLVTDHQPLLWLMTNHALTGRNARWAMRLQEFDFVVKHRPGRMLQHVDGLSRNPPAAEPVAGLMALAREAEKQGEQHQELRGAADIWQDEETLRWLRGETEAEEPASERARARGQHYRWYAGQVQLRTREGWKLVPAPADRESIIDRVHRQLGHFGHVRTTQLVNTGWWWAGMARQIKERVAQCEACDRNKAQLEKSQQQLQSLPIRGLGYRWSLDLAGELPLSRRGKRYILVMIEHVSKWVEVRALSSKSAALVTEAFTEQVLTRMGACGEVLTDQGTEFRGEFDKALAAIGITHGKTSRYHPQADGLTERMVQTLKRGLRAYGEAHKRSWDEDLHWVAAGYRFSKQAALRDVSPYYLLYGREPILPVGAPKVLTDVVTAGTPELWAALAKAKGDYLRALLPSALENLHVAQLRDARRYQQRLGGQRPASGRQLQEGQEVYRKTARQHTLDRGLSEERWKVVEVRESGVVVLENQQGRRVQDHTTNTARARCKSLSGLDQNQQEP